MSVLLEKKLTAQSKTWVFLLIVVLCGLPMWLSSYTQYLQHTWIGGSSVLVAAFCAAWLAWKTNHSFWFVLGYAIGAQLLAFMGKLVIDCIPDPTNHNLFPFELIFFIIIDFLVFSFFILIAQFFKR